MFVFVIDYQTREYGIPISFYIYKYNWIKELCHRRPN